ncbi:MAG: UDP-N-acetylmuramoyl-tripeptide--D-alanyl-D-alanine ligase [Clostridia bacterium]|nr:UDP-N-acetylmuramoyl-tripeptide--D-alanyl-D-alanine ligase [Clostridia bacterium]
MNFLKMIIKLGGNMLQYAIINILWITAGIYLSRKLRNGFHILQLEHYKTKPYRQWRKEHLKKVWNPKELLVILPILITCFYFELGIIIEIIFFILLNVLYKTEKEKKPFVVTNRIKRMYITNTIFIAITWSIVNILLKNQLVVQITNLVYISYILVSYYVVVLLNIVNQPIEKAIQTKFYKQAKKKLQNQSNLKVIGITGSYGKTSTKYIVSTILEQKYNVLMTPESYNTTMGVVRTINEKLKIEHQIFVCEMGARNIGDIQQICDLVKPQYGILTSIGPQHLDTFQTIENVKRTKMELINSLPEQGIAFINEEDENIQTITISNKHIKYGLNKSTCDYYANNIEITENGCTFDVHTKDEHTIFVKTKLLGSNNLLNIVGAICVAKEMGLTDEEIKQGVRLLKPIPHRLELIRGANGLIMIDDAFNSNIKGSKSALEVLASFNNHKKIIVTPGMVELGEKQYEYNKQFGEQIAECADYSILVGEKQAKPIYDGLKAKKYPEEKIYIAKNLEEAIQKMNQEITKDTVVLLENDLPDNYL